MKRKKLLIAGGDMRMLYAAEKLSEKFDVQATGFSNEKLPAAGKRILEKLKGTDSKADTVILPPVTYDSSGNIPAPFAEKPLEPYEIMGKGALGAAVLGGKAGEALCRLCKEKGLDYYNYMERPELALANAVPTAEAAMKLAIEKTGRTIWGSRVLVTGFGRIGTVLTDRLLSLGANVTAAARKEYDRMRIKTMGAEAAEIMPEPERLSEIDVVFNTVPANIFKREHLCRLRDDCVFIDLASAPGGTEMDAVRETGCNYVWASGLPPYAVE